MGKCPKQANQPKHARHCRRRCKTSATRCWHRTLIFIPFSHGVFHNIYSIQIDIPQFRLASLGSLQQRYSVRLSFRRTTHLNCVYQIQNTIEHVSQGRKHKRIQSIIYQTHHKYVFMKCFANTENRRWLVCCSIRSPSFHTRISHKTNDKNRDKTETQANAINRNTQYQHIDFVCIENRTIFIIIYDSIKCLNGYSFERSTSVIAVEFIVWNV